MKIKIELVKYLVNLVNLGGRVANNFSSTKNKNKNKTNSEIEKKENLTK